MKRLIDPLDFMMEEMLEPPELVDQVALDSSPYAKACRGKILATLFYESSMRTRLGFESAMLRPGGSALGSASAKSSSMDKGENVADTIRTVSCYADICAMRHPKEDTPLVAPHYSGIPVINTGDGGYQHPAQTLADLMTVRRKRGRLDQMTIGLYGDSKFGRTVHSFMKSLVHFGDIRFVLIPPEELHVPDYIMQDVLSAHNASYREAETLGEAIPEFDILYTIRIQKERSFSKEGYVRLKDSYILTANKLHATKSGLTVLHPLSHVNEITTEVDGDPRAAYFEQAQDGVYARMALILKLLEVAIC